MAMFTVSQEIRREMPEMDQGERILPNEPEKIPLPIKCKGAPYDLTIRHFPMDLAVDYQGVRVPLFYFKVSLHLKGDQEILVRKRAAVNRAAFVNTMEDLCDQPI